MWSIITDYYQNIIQSYGSKKESSKEEVSKEGFKESYKESSKEEGFKKEAINLSHFFPLNKTSQQWELLFCLLKRPFLWYSRGHYGNDIFAVFF